MGNLVIVSNRLPVSVRKVDGKLEYYPSVGGLATGLSGYTGKRGTKWIGWPGLPSDDLTEADKAAIVQRLRRERCYPVFLTAKQIADFYNGYSNQVLWPLFHDLQTGENPARFWRAYRQVNEIFAKAVLAQSQPESTIWVHDYQLLLMPQLLRAAGRGDRIGLFVHIPFPDQSKLLGLPEAEALLSGMLGADLIGFHTRAYTANFVAACDAALGTGKTRDFVAASDHMVRVGEFPMGIDYERFAEAASRHGNQAQVRKLRKRYRGRTVIISVDRLDPSKGLAERMRAYQTLLRRNPSLHGRIVMAMIVAPSRTDIEAYQSLKAELDGLLADITVEFARPDWQPVDFIYETVPLDMVIPYYQVADIAFITPLRDGMNLVAKEFLASKPDNSGVLVLSQTAGAAEELQDAIQVNPKRQKSLVDGLAYALDLSKHELQSRARRMRRHIEQFTVQRWADNFIDMLQRPRKSPIARTYTLTAERTKKLLADYASAGRRLILLDYDGTLRAFENDPMAAKPSRQVLDMLRRLSENPANEVVVVSGRSRQNLADWFGTLPIAISAEHGAYFRRHGGKSWHRTSQTDDSWKQTVRDLFERYSAMTPGSFVEQKDAAIVWHYRTARPYTVEKNLVALRRLLKPILTRHSLIAKSGDKVLEVHAGDISKGRTAEEWTMHDYDFVLCMGDDVTDEDMFAALPPSGYSIKVGPGSTAARYRVASVAQAVALLEKL